MKDKEKKQLAKFKMAVDQITYMSSFQYISIEQISIQIVILADFIQIFNVGLFEFFAESSNPTQIPGQVDKITRLVHFYSNNPI